MKVPMHSRASRRRPFLTKMDRFLHRRHGKARSMTVHFAPRRPLHTLKVGCVLKRPSRVTLKSGVQHVLAVWPAGSGKSTIASTVAAQLHDNKGRLEVALVPCFSANVMTRPSINCAAKNRDCVCIESQSGHRRITHRQSIPRIDCSTAEGAAARS